MDSLVERIRDWLEYVDDDEECPPIDDSYGGMWKRALIRLSNIEDIRKAADALEQQWIPVSERLPEDKQGVLFVDAAFRDVMVGSFIDEPIKKYRRFQSDDGETFYLNVGYFVTHWMPLPPRPPESGSEE